MAGNFNPIKVSSLQIVNIFPKEKEIFLFSLTLSFFIHIVFLTRGYYAGRAGDGKGLFKPLEVNYYQPKTLSHGGTPFRKAKSGLKAGPKIEESAQAEGRLSNFTKIKSAGASILGPVKDISKLSDPFNRADKQQARFTETAWERKISVPFLKSEKNNNPVYLNYYQIVRNRIKEQAYVSYSKYESGEVYLTFILSSKGALKQIKCIEEKTSGNEYLRAIGLNSIKQASPFPPFPHELQYPELSFNVVISFEVKKKE